MCIANSVGKGCPNSPVDVRTIQLLLNLNASRIPGFVPVDSDGLTGKSTLIAMQAFGRAVLGVTEVLERVDAESPTLAALAAGMPPEFSEAKLHGVMVNARRERIVSFFAPLQEVMTKYQIDSPLRRAHFLAQVGHESAELLYVEEIANGDAYEGRVDLGNTEPGDGRRFKGRGLIQLTGRTNYRDYGRTIGVDLEGNDNWKRVSTDPALTVDVAGWFWRNKELNAVADTDDVQLVTRRVNGGLNGLADRTRQLTRAKFFLSVPRHQERLRVL
jgi:putative chitinase